MASMKMPPPNYIDPPSVGWKLETASLTTIITALVLVLARLYTKICITRTHGWEEYTSIIALCFAIPRTVLEYIGVQVHGLGLHFKDIHPEHYDGFLATGAVSGLLYMPALMFAKLSLLLFFYRIFAVDTKFRYATWAVGTILVLWTTISFLLALFSCRPFIAQFNFKLRLDPKTVCHPENYDVENYYGFCSIITDFALLVMPMPMLYHLKMARSKKIGVAIVFATGGLISGIAIYRQYILFTSSQAGDPSWLMIPTVYWMAIETNLSVACACLPVLTPLARKASLLARYLPDYIRDKISSPSEMEKASWPEMLNGPKHDVEQGRGEKGRVAPWREPSESGSEGSTQALYHHHAMQPLRSVILRADAGAGRQV